MFLLESKTSLIFVKADVLELEPKEHWEIIERDMLLNGFDVFNAEFAFIC